MRLQPVQEIIRDVGDCRFEPGDRVLAPADVGGNVAPGTVKARQVYKTRSTMEGDAETHNQVLVEFDDFELGQKWILREACLPLEG